MKRWLGVIIVLALAGGLWLGASSASLRNWLDSFSKEQLPPAENTNIATNSVIKNANANTPVNAIVGLPAEKNLAVSFTSQAPSANWDQDHEEFCEEAAILMAARYYQRQPFKDTADKEAGLQTIKTWEVQNFGWYYDTDARENATILEQLFKLHVDVVEDPTITQIKAAIAAGQVVIVPAAGRELGNPNFKSPGPIYHNLLIRGYTRDGKFITNDPGTRKGEAYVYDQSVIMDANHDWVAAGDRTVPANGSVEFGRKVILIVRP